MIQVLLRQNNHVNLKLTWFSSFQYHVDNSVSDLCQELQFFWSNGSQVITRPVVALFHTATKITWKGSKRKDS